eukprot:TRINITY_DN16357_c0_g1_i1.p1 TRINITY_DN16357_c0_g1~~TRINITY_DN16357_c0_g1_i1.p1  ORF type:complete len:190 (+),score=1.01 TRINITY_DN16357_c0_g1_i1:60-629(+)
MEVDQKPLFGEVSSSFSASVDLAKYDIYQGCKCRSCEDDECICKIKNKPFDFPLFECHSRCKCSIQCSNRAIQKDANFHLEIQQVTGKGWGVVTLEDLPINVFIGEYVGEIISTEEAKLRWKSYDKAKINYLFVVREYISAKDVTLRTNIDATKYGNISRFLNHSCGPNLSIRLVRLESLIPRICFLYK